MQRKRWKLYYKLFGYDDASDRFGELSQLQFVVGNTKPEDLLYINLCHIDDDGEEEIVASSHKSIMELK